MKEEASGTHLYDTLLLSMPGGIIDQMNLMIIEIKNKKNKKISHATVTINSVFIVRSSCHILYADKIIDGLLVATHVGKGTRQTLHRAYSINRRFNMITILTVL